MADSTLPVEFVTVPESLFTPEQLAKLDRQDAYYERLAELEAERCPTCGRAPKPTEKARERGS